MADQRRCAARDERFAMPPNADFKVEDFVDQIVQVCGAFRIEPKESRRVHGAVGRRRLSRFDAAIVSLDAQRVARDATMIRRDPGEHLFLLFQQSGSSQIVQENQSSELLAGDVFIVDSAVPSEFIYRGMPSRQISLHLPRDETVRRLGRSCTRGMAIGRDDPLLLAVQGVVLGMMRDGREQGPLAEALMNILAACCHARDAGAPDPMTRLHRRAVERIALRAGEPALDLDDLAGDLGVARRTLQRAFTRAGDSVTARLLAARLDLARSRLRALGETGPGGIAALAYDCGFKDLSHFYRRFRERFGMAPGQARRRG